MPACLVIPPPRRLLYDPVLANREAALSTKCCKTTDGGACVSSRRPRSEPAVSRRLAGLSPTTRSPTLSAASRGAEIARNHHNSREIASLAEYFRTGGTRPEPRFRSDTLPMVRHYSDTENLADNIAGPAARHSRAPIGAMVDTMRVDADLMRLLKRVGLAHEPQLYSS
ncbi:hypothetical protein ACH4RG_28725 [Streptomyces sp. NPDC021019]|uniref:hypothetical protein n=2 Tax=unclassified Streptomyces TaxID=2593676 RepID=UPI0037A1A0FC